jgi:hypothetical protein
MFTEFNALPDTSRIWIYQSDTIFTNDECHQISSMITNFIQNWNNHGEGLKSSFLIKYNQFIVLAVDENHKSASGCSIDSSVQLMKRIEREFKVDLFNKMTIAFKDGENINLVSLADFQKYAKADKITDNTIVFNNLVNTKADFETKWEVTADKSWHARFLNKKETV